MQTVIFSMVLKGDLKIKGRHLIHSKGYHGYSVILFQLILLPSLVPVQSSASWTDISLKFDYYPPTYPPGKVEVQLEIDHIWLIFTRSSTPLEICRWFPQILFSLLTHVRPISVRLFFIKKKLKKINPRVRFLLLKLCFLRFWKW